jgi:hypothetical protein
MPPHTHTHNGMPQNSLRSTRPTAAGAWQAEAQSRTRGPRGDGAGRDHGKGEGRGRGKKKQPQAGTREALLNRVEREHGQKKKPTSLLVKNRHAAQAKQQDARSQPGRTRGLHPFPNTLHMGSWGFAGARVTQGRATLARGEGCGGAWGTHFRLVGSRKRVQPYHTRTSGEKMVKSA